MSDLTPQRSNRSPLAFRKVGVLGDSPGAPSQGGGLNALARARRGHTEGSQTKMILDPNGSGKYISVDIDYQPPTPEERTAAAGATEAEEKARQARLTADQSDPAVDTSNIEGGTPTETTPTETAPKQSTSGGTRDTSSASDKLTKTGKDAADAIDNAVTGMGNKNSEYYQEKMATEAAKAALDDSRKERRDLLKSAMEEEKSAELQNRLTSHYKLKPEEVSDLSIDRLKELISMNRRKESDEKREANKEGQWARDWKLQSATAKMKKQGGIKRPQENQLGPRQQSTARANDRLRQYEIGEMSRKHGVDRRTAELMLDQSKHKGLRDESPLMTSPDNVGAYNAMESLSGSSSRVTRSG